MKNKFERLNKEERKNAIEEYANSSENRKDVVKRIKRIHIVTLIGMLYSLGYFIYSFITDTNVFEYIFSSGTFIACVILSVKSKSLLSNNVNNYLIEKKKNNKKS